METLLLDNIVDLRRNLYSPVESAFTAQESLLCLLLQSLIGSWCDDINTCTTDDRFPPLVELAKVIMENQGASETGDAENEDDDEENQDEDGESGDEGSDDEDEDSDDDEANSESDDGDSDDDEENSESDDDEDDDEDEDDDDDDDGE